jgi:hypothetical protein
MARAPHLARIVPRVPGGPLSAAVRIPEHVVGQLALDFRCTPQLFVHEGARQSLERRLGSAHPGPVALAITDNRYSIISHSLRDGVLRARVHHMFLDAPVRVQTALIKYVTRGDPAASQYVGSFIEANGGRLVKRSRRSAPLLVQGKHHDLLTIFDDLNERYFDGQVQALITWGQRGGKRGGRATGARPSTIKLGSYDAIDRLIRVNPSLDRTWVPRYFVAFVVYHEMLHHVIPARNARDADGALLNRRILHPPEFRERERRFRNYERAIGWERRFLARLLRA